MGSLLCATLLQKVGQPTAPKFISKARGQLNREGFAKDWKLALSGKAGDNTLGWRLLKVLQVLTDEQVDSFAPAKAELRSTIKDCLAAIRGLGPQSGVEAIEPSMGALWDGGLDQIVSRLVAMGDESFRKKFDAKLVAASVNGYPLPRGAVRLMEALAAQIPNPLRQDSTDQCINMLLLAQERWKDEPTQDPQHASALAAQLAESLGPDWAAQLEAMGLDTTGFVGWISVLIAQAAQRNELLERGGIGAGEAREFYDRQKSFFRHVHLLTQKLEGDGAAQREQLEKIRQRVLAARDLGAKKKIFDAAGGECQVGEPYSKLQQVLAEAIAKVRDEGVSDIVESHIDGQTSIHLVLIPSGRQPFEQVEHSCGELATLEREVERLRDQAQIVMFDEPAGSDADLIPGQEAAQDAENSIIGTVIGNLKKFAFKVSTGRDAGGADGTMADLHELPLDTSSLPELPSEGNPAYFYTLGAYSERGLGPQPGLESAAASYRRAAEVADPRAMMRLSELYRTGRGVGRDPAEAQKWKEQAMAIVVEIKLDYVRDARIEREALLANMKTKVGNPLNLAVLEADLLRLSESGLVESVNFFREPAPGGVRLIALIEAAQH